MENFLLALPFLIAIGVIALPVWIALSIKADRRKLRRIYDDIQIGDRYQFTISPTNPFDDAQVFNATIINKALAGGKHPWVQYKYDDGSISQDEIDEFLYWHKKTTN